MLLAVSGETRPRERLGDRGDFPRAAMRLSCPRCAGPGDPHVTEQRGTVRDIPELRGRTAGVTGADTGLGTVSALCVRGAHVVLAPRNASRVAAEADRIPVQLRTPLSESTREVPCPR